MERNVYESSLTQIDIFFILFFSFPIYFFNMYFFCYSLGYTLISGL